MSLIQIAWALIIISHIYLANDKDDIGIKLQVLSLMAFVINAIIG